MAPTRLTGAARIEYNAGMKFFVKSLAVSSALLLAGFLTQSAHAEKKGWIALFNGSSTDAFRGYKQTAFPTKGWTVENGALKTIPGGEVVDLVTKEEFKNFDLELDWKISSGGNSGVMFHVAENFPRAYETGPEMQILDDSKHKDGGNPKTSAGALYALMAPTNKVLQPVGQWNHVRIQVINDRVTYWLNEKKVVECNLGSAELKKLIAESKFKTMPGFAKQKTGHICLQFHNDEVWFRNIRVQRL